ncbi:Unknown protein sequence [Pseudomonas coronafaciens pv. oryzae]|nr:Unknown protein sequence [Pseudomonas coronafaciens pv. oryzae]
MRNSHMLNPHVKTSKAGHKKTAFAVVFRGELHPKAVKAT